MSKEKIISSLEELDPDELEKLTRLANKFISQKNNGLKIPVQQTGRKRSSKKPNAKPNKKGAGRSESKHQKEEDQNDVRRGQRGRRGATGKARGKKPARSEPVSISGENRFDRMTERRQYTKDIEIDKKLWGDKKPTPRPEKYEDVEVQCTECELYFDINPSLVYTDPDDGNVIFTCDDCAATRGKD